MRPATSPTRSGSRVRRSIDPTTGTIYVDAATKEVSGGTTTYVTALHALDIATGAEKFGSPVTIQASVSGSGMGSQGGTLSFIPLRENQRTALLLSNGVVYLGFSSRGDKEPFHGWVLGYNATTLQQVMVYCTTPNGDDGGVWMSGDGVAADSTGSLYFITGDGLFDASSGGGDYGDSFVKLSPGGTVLDYFSPRVQSHPGLRQSRSRLRRRAAAARPARRPSSRNGERRQERHDLSRRPRQHGPVQLNSDQIVQSIPNIWTNVTGGESGLFGAPVYFNGNVYFSPLADKVQAFQLTNGLLPTNADLAIARDIRRHNKQLRLTRRHPGDLRQRSNQRDRLGTAKQRRQLARACCTPTTRATWRTSTTRSDQAGTRDQLDPWLKFTIPTVANGRVYVASTGQLTAFGLLP